MDLEILKKELKEYSGEKLNFMEICGSHTAAIAKNGIPSLLSPQISLLSGPGCPVCVAPVSFIESLKAISFKPGYTVAGFGDLLRTPGREGSLLDARSKGASLKMIYSPMELLAAAEEASEESFVLAAVGFETTAPVYAALLEEVRCRRIKNLKLLPALKTMPEVVRWLLKDPDARIDGMLCPGHVCVITGTKPFEELAGQFGIPFVVSGFSGEELLIALYDLLAYRKRGVLRNDYPSVVREEGNPKARALVKKYFETADVLWRGLGVIPGSGLKLRKEYAEYDAGELFPELVSGLEREEKENADSSAGGCCCAQVLSAKKLPKECPLFRKVCTPSSPRGACMTSGEGSCFSAYRYES